ncbi:hypothetical protein D3C78_559670 [compost metagenome]
MLGSEGGHGLLAGVANRQLLRPVAQRGLLGLAFNYPLCHVLLAAIDGIVVTAEADALERNLMAELGVQIGTTDQALQAGELGHGLGADALGECWLAGGAHSGLAQALYLLDPALEFVALARLVGDLLAGSAHKGHAPWVATGVQQFLVVRHRPRLRQRHRGHVEILGRVQFLLVVIELARTFETLAEVLDLALCWLLGGRLGALRLRLGRRSWLIGGRLGSWLLSSRSFVEHAALPAQVLLGILPKRELGVGGFVLLLGGSALGFLAGLLAGFGLGLGFGFLALSLLAGLLG